jgi:hypothetical protein
MSSLLLRQDPAFRSMPRWLAKGLTLTILSLQLVLFLQAMLLNAESEMILIVHPVLALTVWFAPAIYLLAPGVRRRCNDLSMGLPITSRRLWLTHVMAEVISMAVILLVTGGALELHRWLLERVHASVAPSTLEGVALIVQTFSAMALAIVLLQSPDRDLQKVPANRQNVLRTVIILVGTLGLVILLGVLPIFFALLPPVAAWFLGARLYRSLPEAFTVLSRSREEPELADEAALAEVFQRSERRGIRFAFLPGMSTRLYLLDALPIARRTIFALLVVPCMVAISLGYALGVGMQSQKQPPELVEYCCDDPNYYVRVPVRYLEIAWDGAFPTLDSPWGESHVAWGRPIVKGGQAVVYSPFIVSGESSPEFEALLTSRAARAVYGAEIPHTEIMSRYFAVDDSGSINLAKGDLTLRQDYGGFEDQVSLPLFPVVFTAVFLLWVVFASLYYQVFRARFSTRQRRVAFFTLAGVLLLFHLGPFPLYIANRTEPWLIAGYVEIILREITAVLPGGPVAVWILCALAVGLGYRLLESRFERIEIPIE